MGITCSSGPSKSGRQTFTTWPCWLLGGSSDWAPWCTPAALWDRGWPPVVTYIYIYIFPMHGCRAYPKGNWHELWQFAPPENTTNLFFTSHHSIKFSRDIPWIYIYINYFPMSGYKSTRSSAIHQSEGPLCTTSWSQKRRWEGWPRLDHVEPRPVRAQTISVRFDLMWLYSWIWAFSKNQGTLDQTIPIWTNKNQ